MSKLSLSAILAIVKLILKLLCKLVSFIDTIRDLLDNGEIDDSIKTPFSERLDILVSHVFDIISEFTGFEKELSDEI